MNSILDTHFLLWIILSSKRLADYPWIDHYQPWGISPISLLEIELLAEVGRVDLKGREFLYTVLEDPRFRVLNTSVLSLVQHAFHLTWTRDPFDRLLVAHSLSLGLPLCTADSVLQRHHHLLPRELMR